ncbi:5-oxoprolinase subunit B family protein [Tomitella biformata]|uniref:5-oxoprolinase subunit B family protein n=1 Tax=Tomitella biformata TaxID=630403 RepID=UPI000463BE6E|nr:allophanate hydrolase subunit 1 [Tomitella biformata]
MRLLDCGESAILVEFNSLPEVLAFSAAAEAARGEGISDLVPGARTVLVCFEGLPRPAVTTWIRSISAAPAPARTATAVEIPVRYDGPDLDAVAELTGMTVAEVIDAHTETEWTCAFGGFAPGFGYLVGGGPRLRVPRRATPRVSVPAGSVGLAGEFSGVYPRSSPGGWQLLGHTDIELWNTGREPPALIHPGAVVRFRAL